MNYITTKNPLTKSYFTLFKDTSIGPSACCVFSTTRKPPFLTKSFQLHDICDYVSTRISNF